MTGPEPPRLLERVRMAMRSRHYSIRTEQSYVYRVVLERPLPHIEELVRARRPHRIPTVLSRREVHDVLGRMNGVALLVVTILYGTGMRLSESVFACG